VELTVQERKIRYVASAKRMYRFWEQHKHKSEQEERSGKVL
jgi:hypothetical protein